jgi:hypothetical protein
VRTMERAEFVGGMRWHFWNTTRPLARLEVSADGVSATSSFLGRREVALAWNEIVAVEPVRGLIPVLGNGGTAFRSGRGTLIFWASATDSAKIAELAERHLGDRVRSGGRRLVL